MALKWGILGCGDVAEYKGGPPLYSVGGSELVAVMRRDATKVLLNDMVLNTPTRTLKTSYPIRKSMQFISPLHLIYIANRQFR